MATINDHALLSQAIYSNDPQVPGWVRLEPWWPSGTGPTEAFQGAAFRRGGDVVFAFKGTSGGWDYATDFKLGIGMNTYQYSSARDLVIRSGPMTGFNVSLCGHSLGGATAQIVGNRLRLPFVTFNAPGVGLISRNLDEVGVSMITRSAYVRVVGTVISSIFHPVQAARDIAGLFYTVKGVNFRLGKDLVGCTGVHYGKVIEVPYDGGALDVMAKHSIKEVIKALNSSGYGGENLDTVV